MASDIWEVDHAQELLMFHLAKDDRKDKNPSLGIARIGEKKKKIVWLSIKALFKFLFEGYSLVAFGVVLPYF